MTSGWDQIVWIDAQLWLLEDDQTNMQRDFLHKQTELTNILFENTKEFRKVLT